MSTIRVSLCTLALGCLLLTGASLPPAQTSPASTASPRYVDPTYNFSMAIPGFPAAKERSVIATFQGPTEDGFASNVTLVVDPGATTRAAYLETSLKQLRDAKPGSKMGQNNSQQVSGKDAALLDYEFSEAGRRLRFLQLVVFAEDRVYILTCTAPVDTFKNHEAEFRKCIETFRLEK